MVPGGPTVQRPPTGVGWKEEGWKEEGWKEGLKEGVLDGVAVVGGVGRRVGRSVGRRVGRRVGLRLVGLSIHSSSLLELSIMMASPLIGIDSSYSSCVEASVGYPGRRKTRRATIVENLRRNILILF